MKLASKINGFTLIEIMVVIILIGIFSATAMLSTVGLSQRSTNASAQTLLADIQQAWSWAEINRQTTRVNFTDLGYEVQVWSNSSWQSPSQLLFTGYRNTPSDFAMELESSNLQASNVIIFVAGGEYPAFSGELSFGDSRFQIQGDGLNAPTFSDF